MKSKLYVGIKHGSHSRELFKSTVEPVFETHGETYACTIGHFRTKRAAELMRDFGSMNPHMRCVSDCERIARREKAGLYPIGHFTK